MAIKWKKIINKARIVRSFVCLIFLCSFAYFLSMGFGNNQKFSFAHYKQYTKNYYESQMFQEWLLKTMCSMEQTYTRELLLEMRDETYVQDKNQNYKIVYKENAVQVSDTTFMETYVPMDVKKGKIWYYLDFLPLGMHTNIASSASQNVQLYFDGHTFAVSSQWKDEIKNGVIIRYSSGGNVEVSNPKYKYLKKILTKMDWSDLQKIMDAHHLNASSTVYLFIGKSFDEGINYVYAKRFFTLLFACILCCVSFITWLVLLIRIKIIKIQKIKKGAVAVFRRSLSFINHNITEPITGERWYAEGFQMMERKRDLVLFFSLSLIFFYEVLLFLVLHRYPIFSPYIAEFDTIGVVGLFCAAAILLVHYVGTRKIATRYATVDEQILKIANGDYASLEMQAVAPFKREVESLTAIGKGYEKSLEERIRSERTKIELVTNVSHDLKTPLTSIISYIDLLKRLHNLPEEAKDYVDILERKAERLRGIVSDVFEIAKTASGEIKIEKQVLSLNKLLTQTLISLDDKIHLSGFDVKVKLTEKEIYVNTDGQRMYRVLQNLIENALKYSLQGSRIYIEEIVQESIVMIIIKNTANYEMKFTAEDVVERFFCGDKSRNTEGSGLGLSIAQGFTIACGGTFNLEVDGDQFKVILTFQICSKRT